MRGSSPTEDLTRNTTNDLAYQSLLCSLFKSDGTLYTPKNGTYYETRTCGRAVHIRGTRCCFRGLFKGSPRCVVLSPSRSGRPDSGTSESLSRYKQIHSTLFLSHYLEYIYSSIRLTNAQCKVLHSHQTLCIRLLHPGLKRNRWDSIL